MAANCCTRSGRAARAWCLLGVFLRSIGHHRQTYWTFEDTLSQIGLGYGFLYMLSPTDRSYLFAGGAGRRNL